MQTAFLLLALRLIDLGNLEDEIETTGKIKWVKNDIAIRALNDLITT